MPDCQYCGTRIDTDLQLEWRDHDEALFGTIHGEDVGPLCADHIDEFVDICPVCRRSGVVADTEIGPTGQERTIERTCGFCRSYGYVLDREVTRQV